MADDASAIAGLGHNSPPDATPYEAVKVHVEDLMTEARGWLNGDAIETQAQADQVSKLMDMLRKAKTAADNARKEEARPFDDGKAEVQARYKPLMDAADRAVDTCKLALSPFLKAQEAARQRAAAEARRVAEEAAQRAAEAARAAVAGHLEQQEDAEAIQKAAKEAEAAAKRLEKDRSHANGGARATTLRTTYRPELVDANAAASWAWANHRPELEEWLLTIAKQRVAGGLRTIPGFVIHEERKAV